MTISSIRRRLLASGGALLLAGIEPVFAATPEAGQVAIPDAVMLARAIGPNVVLLKTGAGVMRDLMRRALDFGLVKVCTPNACVAMERVGVAMRVEQEGGALPAGADGEAQQRNFAGGYVGGEIDLRFNFDAWRHAFAVTRQGSDGGVTRSLLFFDAQGQAIHTLSLRNEAAGGLFDLLVQDFRAAQQHPSQVAVNAPDALAVPSDNASADAVQRLAPHALRTLLDALVRHKLPVMALAGNAGVTQIYTGLITGAAAQGDDCVAQGPGFSLRVRGHAALAPCVVQRAGAASVECQGADGATVLTLLGLRDRARPQAWAELIQGLPKA